MKKMAKTGLAGTIITAICCFTPVLVILLSGIGLAAWAHYLDYVLWPLLVVFVVIAIIGLVGKRS